MAETEIAPAIDPIIARIELPGARGNHRLMIEPQQRLAFIACEGNEKLVLDMRRMHVMSSFDVVKTWMFWPSSPLHLLYVSGEVGYLYTGIFLCGPFERQQAVAE
ncbi:hypothetical protein PQR02_37440 [Paraburkholderia sediminicola]|uniref:Uncharacterized protein n=1 Tax=Paraburkholderia rhynchosiae TaxID=487049 RepID=A0ACC7NNP1_9BURK